MYVLCIYASIYTLCVLIGFYHPWTLILCVSPFSLSNSTLENIPGQYTFIHLSAVCFLNFEKTKVLSSDL